MQLTQAATTIAGPTFRKVTAENDFNHIVFKELEVTCLECLTGFATTRGGGQHGHVQIMTGTNAAYYNELTSNADAFVVPVHPGAAPTIADGATQHQIAEAVRQYNYSLSEHHAYNAIAQAIKLALLQNIHESHYYNLKHQRTGYANVSFAAIFGHLKTQYATPKREALDQNKVEYSAPHNLNDTVKLTFMKKKECQAFAHGTRAEISDNNLLQDTLGAFERTGCRHFQKKVADFEARAVGDQTWANLFKDMETAETNRKKDPETSKDKGYHANSATEPKEEPKEEKSQTDPGVVKIGNRKFGYCFTHGLTRNSKHTSLTCRTPCECHKKEATLDNMMGGSAMIQVPRGYQCLVPQE